MIPVSEGNIGAYWLARKEHPEVCAGRLAHCLLGLRELSPLFGQWLHARPGGRVEIPVDSSDVLASIFAASRNKSDFPPGNPIEDLGCNVALITDHQLKLQTSVQTTCGMYRNDPAILNNCLLKFAPEGELSYRAVSWETKRKALEILIQAWDPDWAVLRSQTLRKSLQAGRKGVVVEPYFGWISFVSERRGEITEAIRQKFQIEPIPGRGSLVYATSE